MTIKKLQEMSERKRRKTNYDLPVKDRLDVDRLRRAVNDRPLCMNFFLKDTDSVEQFMTPKAEACGTIGCIAGNVVLEKCPTAYKQDEYIDTADIAAYLLGLTYEEASLLFYSIYPTAKIGTKAYQDAVRKVVNQQLREWGVKERV